MSHVPAARHTRALLMLLVANFFWGLSFPVIKSILLLHERLVPAAGSAFLTIYTVAPRFLLAVLLMIALRPRDWWRATPGERKQGVLLGLFATAGLLLQNDGLQFTAASTSAFLTQFYAILIPIWVAWRQQRNPGARIWIAGVFVLAGVAILGRFDWHELRLGRGEIETLLASCFFMGQILMLERKEFSGNRPERITFLMFTTQALILGLLVPIAAPNAEAIVAPWTSPAWLVLTLVLTVLCTHGAYSLMNAWQPKITATEAGLIYCIEPIFGSLMAAFLPAIISRLAGIDYPNETATWTLLVGGGLITVANVLVQLKPPAKE